MAPSNSKASITMGMMVMPAILITSIMAAPAELGLDLHYTFLNADKTQEKQEKGLSDKGKNNLEKLNWDFFREALTILPPSMINQAWSHEPEVIQAAEVAAAEIKHNRPYGIFNGPEKGPSESYKVNPAVVKDLYGLAKTEDGQGNRNEGKSELEKESYKKDQETQMNSGIGYSTFPTKGRLDRVGNIGKCNSKGCRDLSNDGHELPFHGIERSLRPSRMYPLGLSRHSLGKRRTHPFSGSRRHSKRNSARPIDRPSGHPIRQRGHLIKRILGPSSSRRSENGHPYQVRGFRHPCRNENRHPFHGFHYHSKVQRGFRHSNDTGEISFDIFLKIFRSNVGEIMQRHRIGNLKADEDGYQLSRFKSHTGNEPDEIDYENGADRQSPNVYNLPSDLFTTTTTQHVEQTNSPTLTLEKGTKSLGVTDKPFKETTPAAFDQTDETVTAQTTPMLHLADEESQGTNTSMANYGTLQLRTEEHSLPGIGVDKGKATDGDSSLGNIELGTLLSSLQKTKNDLEKCQEQVHQLVMHNVENALQDASKNSINGNNEIDDSSSSKISIGISSSADTTPTLSRSAINPSSSGSSDIESSSVSKSADTLPGTGDLVEMLWQPSPEDISRLDKATAVQVQHDLVPEGEHQGHMMPGDLESQDILFDPGVMVVDLSDLSDDFLPPLDPEPVHVPQDPLGDALRQLLARFEEQGSSQGLHASEKLVDRLKEEIRFTKQELSFCHLSKDNMS
ncbi:hypothetical protein EGW08_000290 [Elysia chlorotica]|uniref:Uncharacterized protein n=1 Tax=Elysia chlorotica TaxID=188477 RepID=A0A3S1A1D3_ELYCH|nr:hypothetical protein EGW08_000290 [Elysia chlorotica]